MSDLLPEDGEGRGPALTWVRHARLLGAGRVVDLLLGAGRILAVAEELEFVPDPRLPVARHDVEGRWLMPGLIDGHVHLAGGGGEGGFDRRTPPMTVASLVEAGVTTAVGLLGTDGVTRSVAGLLAHARALRREGISTRIFTGAYEVPTRTLTGSLRSDLVLVEDVVGTGEIAIADDRSSHPSGQDLAQIAAETRVGALLAGKPGVLHLHVGHGRRGLDPVLACLRDHELPPWLFQCTHLNRREALLEQALQLLEAGGCADLTAGLDPDPGEPTAVPAHTALARLLDRAGAHAARITLSSDAGGSAPSFDASGRLVALDVGRPEHLWEAVRRAVREEGVPLDRAAACVTAHPAKILGLSGKGTLAAGADADLVVLEDDLTLGEVFAGGRVVARHGKALVRGPFDPPPAAEG